MGHAGAERALRSALPFLVNFPALPRSWHMPVTRFCNKRLPVLLALRLPVNAAVNLPGAATLGIPHSSQLPYSTPLVGTSGALFCNITMQRTTGSPLTYRYVLALLSVTLPFRFSRSCCRSLPCVCAVLKPLPTMNDLPEQWDSAVSCLPTVSCSAVRAQLPQTTAHLLKRGAACPFHCAILLSVSPTPLPPYPPYYNPVYCCSFHYVFPIPTYAIPSVCYRYPTTYLLPPFTAFCTWTQLLTACHRRQCHRAFCLYVTPPAPCLRFPTALLYHALNTLYPPRFVLRWTTTPLLPACGSACHCSLPIPAAVFLYAGSATRTCAVWALPTRLPPYLHTCASCCANLLPLVSLCVRAWRGLHRSTEQCLLHCAFHRTCLHRHRVLRIYGGSPLRLWFTVSSFLPPFCRAPSVGFVLFTCTAAAIPFHLPATFTGPDALQTTTYICGCTHTPTC